MSSEDSKVDTSLIVEIKEEKVTVPTQKDMELSDADLDQVIGAHGKY